MEKARGGAGEGGREDIAAMIDMFAGVLHLRRGRLTEATEKFETRRPHLRSAGRPQIAGRCHDGAGQHANEGGPAR